MFHTLQINAFLKWVLTAGFLALFLTACGKDGFYTKGVPLGGGQGDGSSDTGNIPSDVDLQDGDTGGVVPSPTPDGGFIPPGVDPSKLVGCGHANGQPKYLICHKSLQRGCHSLPTMPRGQTLCLPLPAIMNGHIDHHAGDYWGPCR